MMTIDKLRLMEDIKRINDKRVKDYIADKHGSTANVQDRTK